MKQPRRVFFEPLVLYEKQIVITGFVLKNRLICDKILILIFKDSYVYFF